jgi:hypothetical protein
MKEKAHEKQLQPSNRSLRPVFQPSSDLSRAEERLDKSLSEVGRGGGVGNRRDDLGTGSVLVRERSGRSSGESGSSGRGGRVPMVDGAETSDELDSVDLGEERKCQLQLQTQAKGKEENVPRP